MLEQLQSNSQLALERMLGPLDERYSRREEIQELRGQVQRLTTSVESIQIGMAQQRQMPRVQQAPQFSEQINAPALGHSRKFTMKPQSMRPGGLNCDDHLDDRNYDAS